MDEIIKALNALEKLINAEESWTVRSCKQSAEINFSNNFSEDSVLHDITYNIITDVRDKEQEVLSEAKKTVNALKKLYNSLSQGHRLRAYKIFSESLGHADQKGEINVQYQYSQNERTRRADEVYIKTIDFARSLEKKLTKEQINFILNNEEIDEESARDLNEKLNQEIAQYKRQYDCYPYDWNAPAVKEMDPDYPLLSKAKTYVFAIQDKNQSPEHCNDGQDFRLEFKCLSEQIALQKAEDALSERKIYAYQESFLAVKTEDKEIRIKEYMHETQAA